LVKVLDFGLAKLTDAKGTAPIDSEAATREQVKSQAGTILGTVSAKPTKQWRGWKRDFSSET
jgi:hypothetical protein